MTALVKHEETTAGYVERIEPAPMMAVTPMAMLSQAVAKGASIEILTKLMDLSERWEANQARKAFNAAVASAKAEIPVIGRNATGHNNKRYADFSAYAAVIDPILAKHDLSYRFTTHQGEKISVTCILSHKAGHAESNTLCGPADKTGSKNDIQAIGSTLTYLQRYTLVQALGLAAGHDDDGKASGNKPGDDAPISDAQVKEVSDLIADTKSDFSIFLKTFGVKGIPDLTVGQLPIVLAKLRAKLAKMQQPQ